MRAPAGQMAPSTSHGAGTVAVHRLERDDEIRPATAAPCPGPDSWCAGASRSNAVRPSGGPAGSRPAGTSVPDQAGPTPSEPGAYSTGCMLAARPSAPETVGAVCLVAAMIWSGQAQGRDFEAGRAIDVVYDAPWESRRQQPRTRRPVWSLAAGQPAQTPVVLAGGRPGLLGSAARSAGWLPGPDELGGTA